MVESFFFKLAQWEKSGDEAAICTIINTTGSTPRKVGAKMLVYGNGSIYSSIGGGTLEMKVISDALSVIRTKKAKIFAHALVQDHGMCCGGTVDIFIEPLVKRKKLYIFGAGHIGKALALFARDLDFMVTVFDERKDAFLNWKPEEITQITGKHRTEIKRTVFDKDTFIAVVTHKHAYDREIIALCAEKQHAYLGMIGSERKVAMAKKVFSVANSPTKSQLKGIDWPMGINIKVETPSEIAIAILAKIIDTRSKLSH